MKLVITGTKFAILYGGTGNRKTHPNGFPPDRLDGSTVAAYVLVGYHPYIPFFLLSPLAWGLGTGFTHTYGILEYIIICWIMLDWTGSGVTVYLLANMGVVYYILKAWISFFLEQPYTINHNKN